LAHSSYEWTVAEKIAIARDYFYKDGQHLFSLWSSLLHLLSNKLQYFSPKVRAIQVFGGGFFFFHFFFHLNCRFFIILACCRFVYINLAPIFKFSNNFRCNQFVCLSNWWRHTRNFLFGKSVANILCVC
jgi:hypothetical protein